MGTDESALVFSKSDDGDDDNNDTKKINSNERRIIRRNIAITATRACQQANRLLEMNIDRIWPPLSSTCKGVE